MNHPAPRARRGAHRTRRDPAGAVAPSLLAVLAVVALVTSLYVWRGQDSTAGRTVAAATTTTSSSSSSAAASPVAAPPVATQPSTPATSPATPTAQPSTATPTPRTSTPAAAARVGRLEVVVLNQTKRAGLAKIVADRLRGKGWTVVKTGNFHGAVPATTVYFPVGAEADALAAAAGLPVTPRVKPGFGNLSTSRLTVIVTASYPS